MLIVKYFLRELQSHLSEAGNGELPPRNRNKLNIVNNDKIENSIPDARMKHLPLVNNYSSIILLMAGYVAFVTKIGPKYMSNRKPYNVKFVLRVYNIFQICLNIYMFTMFMKHYITHPRYNWLCMHIDKTDNSPETLTLIRLTHICYMSKVLDTLDTIFSVLRKKNNQISFLHVYHHTSMIWASFLYHIKFFGSVYTAIGHVNSFVHILMYSYYLLSSMDLKLNLESWKPRLTEIQIIQFGYYTIKFGSTLMNNTCGMSMGWLIVLFMQNLFVSWMFCAFYYKTYIVKDRKIKKCK